MHVLPRDWCFSPLAWASIYFITTHHERVPLEGWVSKVLRGSYWLHTETVTCDEWIPVRSNSEINWPAVASLGLCDGWSNTVIKWEVATMSPCQLWQHDPQSTCNGVRDTSSFCTCGVSLTFAIYIYHLSFPCAHAMEKSCRWKGSRWLDNWLKRNPCVTNHCAQSNAAECERLWSAFLRLYW